MAFGSFGAGVLTVAGLVAGAGLAGLAVPSVGLAAPRLAGVVEGPGVVVGVGVAMAEPGVVVAGLVPGVGPGFGVVFGVVGMAAPVLSPGAVALGAVVEPGGVVGAACAFVPALDPAALVSALAAVSVPGRWTFPFSTG